MNETDREIVAAIRQRIKAELPWVILSGLRHQQNDHGEIKANPSTAKRIAGAVANALDNVIQEEIGKEEMVATVQQSKLAGPRYATKMTRLREQLRSDRAFIQTLKARVHELEQGAGRTRDDDGAPR